MTIKYRPGAKHQNADALTRPPIASSASARAARGDDGVIGATTSGRHRLKREEKGPVRAPLAEAQWNDSEFGPVLKFLFNGELPEDPQAADVVQSMAG